MTIPTVTNNIFILKINSIENASAVNIGQNVLADWSNQDKRTQGYGQNYGDHGRFCGNTHYIDDKDLIDSPSSSVRPLYIKEGRDPK